MLKHIRENKKRVCGSIVHNRKGWLKLAISGATRASRLGIFQLCTAPPHWEYLLTRM